MDTANYSEKPTLVLVTGRPGAGKTTLAQRLSRAIRCPLVSRDAVKEGYVNTLGASTLSEREKNAFIYEVFFDTVDFLLDRQITLVIEAAFQHHVWEPKITPLRPKAHIKLVICTLDPHLAQQRVIQRGLADPDWGRFHDDSVVQSTRDGNTAPITPYNPPQFDLPTLTVDTTTDYQPGLDDILAFTRKN